MALLVLSLLSINLFKKDKIAYVFSSMVESSQTASLILSAEVAAQRPLFELIASHFDFRQKKFPVAQRSSLQISDSVQYIQIDEIQGSQNQTLDSLGELSDQYKSILAKSRGDLDTNVVFFPSQKDRFAIIKKVNIAEVGSGVFRVSVVLKRNPFLEIINQPKFYDLFLVSEKAYMVQKPDQVAEKDYLQILKEFFKENKANLKSSLAREVSVAGTDYMITWSPLGYGELGFVSILRAEKSLQAIAKAKQTSIAILLLLLGIGLSLVMFFISGLTKNIEILSSLLEQFSKGDLSVKAQIQSSDEVGFLANIFNQMTVKIKNLLEETQHKVRMESELETARTVQQRLIPSKVDHDSTGGLICGHYEPASECGGDWWFYFEEDDFFYFIIADVTGHGVSSALITSALRAAVAAQSHIRKEKLEDFVSIINRVIADSASGSINATSFVARYNNKKHEMDYVNVSHCAPLLICAADGTVEFLDEIGGRRFGEKRDQVYVTTTCSVHPGDVIFVYTDGLSEFRNKSDKMFGDKRIVKAVKKCWDEKLKLPVYRKELLKSFEEFKKDLPLDDDLTFFFFQAK